MAIFASGYPRVRFLRWIALPALFIASALCALWFGHELIFVYGRELLSST